MPAIGVLLCLLALGRSGWSATVAEIAKHPESFDQKTVTVVGTANQVDRRTSRRGNAYTTFRLIDRAESVKVFTFGTPDIKDGERVEVRGRFQRVKQVGSYTFHDEIDATSIKPASSSSSDATLVASRTRPRPHATVSAALRLQVRGTR
jgi:DNA polymerase III alpha subunit